MRRFLPLLLCLLLALPLAACGEDPAADAVPMPTDGGEEAQIQLDPDDPLSNYLDLTQLDAQTAAGATQELNLTSENGGCQVVLQKAVGDAMTLHLSLEMTYAADVDLSEPTVFNQPYQEEGYSPRDIGTALILGTVTDPAQAAQQASDAGISSQGTQTGDRTWHVLITFSYREAVLTPGQDVTLLYEDRPTGTSHLFHWTVETQAPIRQAELTDQEGNVAGTGVFSPFAAYLTIQDNAIATSMEPDLLLEQMVFLDESGAPVDGFQGTGVGGSAAPMLFEADAFVPVSPDQLSAVRLGEHTLDIVWTGQEA